MSEFLKVTRNGQILEIVLDVSGEESGGTLSAVMAAPVLAQDEMAGPEAFTAEDEIYVPIVSKGFQHQFWQAVKQGSEQAAADLGVEIFHGGFFFSA